MLSISVLGITGAIVFPLLRDYFAWDISKFSSALLFGYLLSLALFSQTADYFRNTHRLFSFNVLTVVQPYAYIGTALSCYLFTSRLTISTLLASYIAATLGITIYFLFKLTREIGISVPPNMQSEWEKDMRLGFPITLSYLVEFLLSGGDRFIIAALLSVREVGIYSPAYTIGALILFLPRALGVILPPILVRQIDSGEAAKAHTLAQSAIRIFVAIAIPYVFGGLIMGQSVLSLYTTDRIGEQAWPIIPLISIASCLYGLTLIKTNLAFIKLQTGLIFRVNAVSSLACIALDFLLLSIFSNVIWAAIASIIAFGIGYWQITRSLRSDLGTPSIDRNWFLCITWASIGMAFTLLVARSIIPPTTTIHLAFLILIGISSYLLFLWIQPQIRNMAPVVFKSLMGRS
jgi:O-antigen/teichoic acid export membrane protein